MADTPVVCIVDDDESVRVSLRTLARSLGYAAHAFASAEAYLASPQANATDCLISDVQMPTMGGVELQRALIDRGAPPPMIFITAFPHDKIRKQVLDAGAVCLLIKPWDGDHLIECIGKAIARRRPAD